ncbi:class I SAM-dependent methyltransferase [Fibrella sp. WM1]|uniref:class I SAM-dependent methyltransferase n=1 Tax=Fibrella musci TaxID=3242485 RepID=UPI00352040B7
MASPDYFSEHASIYARYRIDYPGELYDFLMANVPGRQTAWDCATGNGQAAVALSNYFEQVEATDLSLQQLQNATHRHNIHYQEATAEQAPFLDDTFDLITVGQALHWFDVPAFHVQAERVLKPNGVIAEWGYGLNEVTPAVDALLRYLYTNVLGPYWDPLRRHIETEYRDLPFPFKNVKEARFVARREWLVEWYMNYLRTWSAVQAFRKRNGYDIIDQFDGDFRRAWGTQGTREVRFPIFLRLGMKK